MFQVSGESEMRYLLLEKDIEERDALDLITKYSIFSFLKSQYAENVVKEIWRSPYAMSDTIFQASTNFFLLFNFYNCEQDQEIKHRLFAGKHLKQIDNHSMQFTVWRYSGKSRTIVDFATTIIIATVIHRLLQQVLNMDAGLNQKVFIIKQMEQRYTTLSGQE
jgi:hypothetical protein